MAGSTPGTCAKASKAAEGVGRSGMRGGDPAIPTRVCLKRGGWWPVSSPPTSQPGCVPSGHAGRLAAAGLGEAREEEKRCEAGTCLPEEQVPARARFLAKCLLVHFTLL